MKRIVPAVRWVAMRLAAPPSLAWRVAYRAQAYIVVHAEPLCIYHVEAAAWHRTHRLPAAHALRAV